MELGRFDANMSYRSTAVAMFLESATRVDKVQQISSSVEEALPETHVTRSQDYWKFVALPDENTTVKDIQWLLSRITEKSPKPSAQALFEMLSKLQDMRALGDWHSADGNDYKKGPYFRTVSKTDTRELDRLSDKLQWFGRKRNLRMRDLDKARVMLCTLKVWLGDELGREGDTAEVLRKAKEAFERLISRAELLYPWV